MKARNYSQDLGAELQSDPPTQSKTISLCTEKEAYDLGIESFPDKDILNYLGCPKLKEAFMTGHNSKLDSTVQNETKSAQKLEW